MSFRQLAFAVVLVASSAPLAPAKTPLDDYIARPDPAYSWKLLKTIPGNGVTTFVLDLKSQTWRAPPEVDRALWQHWLTITKPDRVDSDTAMLWIGGGNNKSKPPDKANPLLIPFALATHTVVAELSMVPNQPLVFNGDDKPRYEDDLIAYCWIKYMETHDPTWLPRLPMVKSAVRAMDAMTEMMGSEAGGKTALRKFVVAGGSKRGWTTWLTGAVDPRVVAIVPIVIDVVNVKACKINHYSAYGFWAAAIGDYTRHRVHERMETPEYEQILKIVDPYSYRDRLTMPKYVVNASGDQYFPPDSSKFYFDALQGVKYLRYVPNANHSLKGSDAHEGIQAFYRAIVNGAPMPKFSWKLESDGSISVRTQDKPTEVNLWQATNSKARDFRLDSIGPAYTKSSMSSTDDGVYSAKVNKPASGWTAFFVELVFPSGEKIPYKFTTQVQIVPDVLPHSYQEWRTNLQKTTGAEPGNPTKRGTAKSALQKDGL